MKKIVTAILFAALGASAGAQTVIERYTAGGHPEGTFYYLPKTALHISIMVEKTQYTPGSMCMYADKYLRIKNVRQNTDVSHKVIGIKISPYAVADTAKCYTVKYNGKSVGTNMQLSEDGCLLAVNTENTVPATPTVFTPHWPVPSHATDWVLWYLSAMGTHILSIILLHGKWGVTFERGEGERASYRIWGN